jgi:cold shock CspA family protein
VREKWYLHAICRNHHSIFSSDLSTPFIINQHNMAESWNKKEREKKKQQLKKEKEEKKKERKEGGAKNFDDMIMYIDENGNFTSTPPDPTKRKQINVEDIEIGVPKAGEISPEDRIHKGTVTFFNMSKGYGFIKDHLNQERVFVHINELSQPLQEMDVVEFEIEMSHKGPTAVKVKKTS